MVKLQVFIALLLSIALAGCPTWSPDIYRPQPSAPINVPIKNNDRSDPPPIIQQHYTVALLLPLSGAQRAIAQDIADSVLLSLRLLDEEERVELVTYDTQGTETGTIHAVSKAMQHNPAMVLGPFFGRNAQYMARYARTIPVLSFSNDHNISQHGVYSFGFLPAQQVQFVMESAVEQGYNRFSALLPDTEYGRMLGKIFDQTLKSTSTIKGYIGYYSQFDQTLENQLKAIAALPALPEVEDALFIPADHEYLVAILRRFKRIDDLSRFRLLGTAAWDTPRTLSIPELQGAWFASTDPAERAHFETLFQQTYGRAPNRMASLGYDAGALAYILSTGLSGAAFSVSALTNPRGFDGINGIFTIQPEGFTSRKLTLLEIQNGRAIVAP